MKHFYFIGSFYPYGQYDILIKDSKNALGNANDLLQKSFIRGLEENDCMIDLITAPSIGSFPSRYKKIWYNGKSFDYTEKIICKSLSFINLPFIKHMHIYMKLKRYLKSLMSKDEDIIFVVYDLYIPFIKAAIEIKNKCDAKVYVMIPDLVGMTDSPYPYVDKYLSKVVEQLLSQCDGFVLLTKQMSLKLPITNQPFCIIEGIYNNVNLSKDYLDVIKTEYNGLINEKYLFYSGDMGERNGVKVLVDALEYIKDTDLKLVLCGSGSLNEYIIKKSHTDHRIIFCGDTPHNLVLFLERNAEILINPRPAIGEFVNFSFPSKTMEYFASKVPVIMFKLPGVPEEYYNYCYQFDAFEPERMAEIIKKVLSKSTDEKRRMAVNANKFIIECKSPKVQVQKFLDMVYS